MTFNTTSNKELRSSLSPFDYLVLLGGGINLIVIAIIIFYWITL